MNQALQDILKKTNLRDYQHRLLEDAKKTNTILYLPSEYDQLYITTLLIKDMGEPLIKPIGNGRKWTFLITESIHLARRQVQNLRNHLPWNIKLLNDEMHIDCWLKTQWDSILNNFHVIIMTAEIYLNNLQHDYMNVNDANLIIFNECHQAVLNHSFKKIMELVHKSNLKNNKQPRILGLTSTLFNSNTKNVIEELKELQLIFNATIKTKDEVNAQIVLEYPKELVRFYDEHVLNKNLNKITDEIDAFICYMNMLQIPNDVLLKSKEKNFFIDNQKPILENILNYFFELKGNIQIDGPQIGYVAISHYMIEIIKIEKQYEENLPGIIQFVLSAALSKMIVIQKMLNDYLNCLTNMICPFYNPLSTISNTSPKLIEFVDVLSTIKPTDICLVIVDCKKTAKFLYHYIQDLYSNDNKNIVCSFIEETVELYADESLYKLAAYKINKNNGIIKKFKEKKINVLITSNILEDCLPYCNYIIRYDYPKNFLSYIQSKSKLCSDSSTLIILAPSLIDFKEIHLKYIEMENEMKKALLVKNEKDDDSSYVDNLQVFKTNSITITPENAIQILNRYCTSLPYDRFTELFPRWYIVDNSTEYKKFKVLLPINSAIKGPIHGMLCKNINNAKMSAALNACIELYTAKALDDRLLPVQVEDARVFTEPYWFPHWNQEESEMYYFKSKSCKMEVVNIKSPSFLHGACPQVAEQSYLHVINCFSENKTPDNLSNEAIIKLINSNQEFGILTSKKLPNISNFPIFLKDCDVNVHIKVNVDIIYLDQESLEKLKMFHSKLFVDLLGVKKFLCGSYDNENNSYLIVPIDSSDNIYSLDWDVVGINRFIETHKEPTMGQRKSMCYEEYFKTRSVISPWYRNVDPIKRYFVTDVKYDMTPNSPFPSAVYGTYESYFAKKYGIRLVQREQPLIEAQILNITNINYLTPLTASDKKKKPDLIELLIPELCIWHEFPSVLWLKAFMLPTILYRINQLLLAEDLIIKTNSLIGRDHIHLNRRLIVDFSCGHFETKKSKNKITCSSIFDQLKYLNNSHVYNRDDWNLKSIPIDIERQTISNTTLVDILNYYTVLSDLNCNQNINNANTVDNENVLDDFKNFNLNKSKAPVLHCLEKHCSNQYFNIEQTDMIKVMTPMFINDMFNYKRLEMYGESFLNFAVSLVLYDAFKLENVRFLSKFRIKLCGNRNLYYIGKSLNIGSYLMVNDFDPVMDWVPPGFSVPKSVKKIIEDKGVKSEFLDKVFLSEEEQLSGKLSDITMDNIATELMNFKEMTDISEFDYKYVDNNFLNYSTFDIFLNKQLVKNKTVIKSVKSLIGTYLYRFDIEEGFKFLHGLGIIPKEFKYVFKPKSYINSDEMDQNLNYSDILPGYEILENKIGYSFKHKALLVQAFTHPSYPFKYSECYQRLEFLGDAILEFLIMSYLTDHCNEKTPTNIAMIKDSIVNNCTYASISTRIGLHKFILARSVKLINAIDNFNKHRLLRNHKVGQEILYYMEENECYTAEYIDVPNVLADLFKSFVCAIYLDSGRDLNLTWTICFNLMKTEIEYFLANIFKSPLDIIQETNLSPSFRIPNVSIQSADGNAESMIKLHIMVNANNMTTYGFGQNKKQAKIAAAKLALKNINNLL